MAISFLSHGFIFVAVVTAVDDDDAAAIKYHSAILWSFEWRKQTFHITYICYYILYDSTSEYFIRNILESKTYC